MTLIISAPMAPSESGTRHWHMTRVPADWADSDTVAALPAAGPVLGPGQPRPGHRAAGRGLEL